MPKAVQPFNKPWRIIAPAAITRGVVGVGKPLEARNIATPNTKTP
jgi:hypothetical protein